MATISLNTKLNIDISNTSSSLRSSKSPQKPSQSSKSSQTPKASKRSKSYFHSLSQLSPNRLAPHFKKPTIPWASSAENLDTLAINASLQDKANLLVRIGLVFLSTGCSAWRIEDAIQEMAGLLKITCSCDISLLTIECTCFHDREVRIAIASIPTTGVDTHRIMLASHFIDDMRTEISELTLRDIHNRLDKIMRKGLLYNEWWMGLASAISCACFVFLIGGGLGDMIFSFIGAGFGKWVQQYMSKYKFNPFLTIAASTVVACGVYIIALVLGVQMHWVPSTGIYQAGYIGAMLYLIPGFPLITSGLDIAKLHMRSGSERLGYALTIILITSLVAWMLAAALHFDPGKLTHAPFPPEILIALWLIASFIGVAGIAIMYNADFKIALLGGIGGSIANTLRLVSFTYWGIPLEAATFIGTFTAGILATFFRKKHKIPRVMATVPAAVIMDPGSYMYRAMYYLCSFNIPEALDWFVKAALIVAFLPIGLVFARMLTDRHWLFRA